MAILKVANMGNPVLRHEAEPVTSRDLKSLPVQQLIDDMIDTLYEYHGVGLAGRLGMRGSLQVAWRSGPLPGLFQAVEMG